MIKYKINIWQYTILLAMLIISFNLQEIFDVFSLIRIIITDYPKEYEQIKFDFIDITFSTVSIFMILVVSVLLRRRKFFQKKIDFFSGSCILIIIAFLTTPLIAPFHPEFKKDLANTRLLPPFSSKLFVYLKTSNNEEEALFLRLITKQYNNNVLICDSIDRETGIYFINSEKKILNNEVMDIKNKIYYFGSNGLGEDVFSGVIWGLRTSITIGAGATLLTALIGIILGFISAYTGGLIDTIINRIAEMFLMFPIIFIVLLMVALFGNSIMSVILVLGVSGWMSLFKIVRGEIVSIKKKDFFVSAKLLDLSRKQLLVLEIVPVIITPIVINLVFQFSNVILAESALSYLGLSAGNSYRSWGGMINSGQEYLSIGWWNVFFPGAALIVTILSVNGIAGKDN